MGATSCLVTSLYPSPVERYGGWGGPANALLQSPCFNGGLGGKGGKGERGLVVSENRMVNMVRGWGRGVGSGRYSFPTVLQNFSCRPWGHVTYSPPPIPPSPSELYL